jgi:hypothetical protein
MQRAGYRQRTIEHWATRFEIAAWNGLDERLAAVLEEKLREIARLLPPKALAGLRAAVPIVADLVTPDCSSVAVYHWRGCGAELAKIGEPAWKAGSINVLQSEAFLALVTDFRRFPYALLHEMAHAFQDHCVPDGHRNRDIIAAHERAMASGDYEMVMNVSGTPRRANAIKDPLEYFASSSTAYFAQNDDWPTSRAELEDVDSVGFQLVRRLWEA